MILIWILFYLLSYMNFDLIKVLNCFRLEKTHSLWVIRYRYHCIVKVNLFKYNFHFKSISTRWTKTMKRASGGSHLKVPNHENRSTLNNKTDRFVFGILIFFRLILLSVYYNLMCILIPIRQIFKNWKYMKRATKHDCINTDNYTVLLWSILYDS